MGGPLLCKAPTVTLPHLLSILLCNRGQILCEECRYSCLGLRTTQPLPLAIFFTNVSGEIRDNEAFPMLLTCSHLCAQLRSRGTLL